MEALIMANIKRRISALAAAFMMMGAVTVPSAAKYVTKEAAVTASAAEDYFILYNYGPTKFRADVKAKTKFREYPCKGSKAVASVSKRTYGDKVYFIYYASTDDGIWYYSQYDKGWVRESDIIS